MSTRKMAIDEEIVKAVKDVKKSLFFPNQKALMILYKFYKKMNPRNGACFTCSGDRAKILKYCENYVNDGK